MEHLIGDISKQGVSSARVVVFILVGVQFETQFVVWEVTNEITSVSIIEADRLVAG